MHSQVLRYVDQVARSGSIRRAADELNVSASAINRQILKLEAELGCPLFERLSSGVRPTQAGEILLTHVRRTLSDWRNTTSGIASLTGEISGEVRILSISPLLTNVLSLVVNNLTEEHESLSFVVWDSNISDSVKQMQVGDPDIALLPFDRRYHHYDILDTLVMKMGAVVAPNHPLADRESVTFSECAEHPVVLLDDSWIDRRSEFEFRNTGARYEPRIQSNSWMFVRKMIRAGKGIGFFTPVGIVDELERKELKFIPVGFDEHENSRLSIYVHEDRRSSTQVMTVVDSIKRRFDKVRELMDSLA